MQDLIEDELRAVLGDWNAGKAVRSIALGHSTRVEGLNDHGKPLEVRNVFRQRKALAYVFQLIAAGLPLMPITWSEFFEICLEEREAGKLKHDLQPLDYLSREEIEAAESFAWKALLRGWNRALTGFSDSSYISIAKEKPAA